MAQQDGSPVLREVGGTKLKTVTPGLLRAQAPLTFPPAQAPRLTRSVSGHPNTCPQDVPNEKGNVKYTPQRLCLPSSRGEEVGHRQPHCKQRRPCGETTIPKGSPASRRPARAGGARRRRPGECWLGRASESVRTAWERRLVQGPQASPPTTQPNPTSKGDSAHSTATN